MTYDGPERRKSERRHKSLLPEAVANFYTFGRETDGRYVPASNTRTGTGRRKQSSTQDAQIKYDYAEAKEYATRMGLKTDFTEHITTPASSRDWPEDFSHDNGDYQCLCTKCGCMFIGYKRRVVCKACSITTPAAERSLDCLKVPVDILKRLETYHDEGGCMFGVFGLPGFFLTADEAIRAALAASPSQEDVAGDCAAAEIGQTAFNGMVNYEQVNGRRGDSGSNAYCERGQSKGNFHRVAETCSRADSDCHLCPEQSSENRDS